MYLWAFALATTVNAFDLSARRISGYDQVYAHPEVRYLLIVRGTARAVQNSCPEPDRFQQRRNGAHSPFAFNKDSVSVGDEVFRLVFVLRRQHFGLSSIRTDFHDGVPGPSVRSAIVINPPIDSVFRWRAHRDFSNRSQYGDYPSILTGIEIEN